MQDVSKLFFVCALAIVASGMVSPGLALLAGILFASLFSHPFPAESSRWSKRLLQISVVALGFGLEFGELVKTGRATLGYTAVGIALSMAGGLLLGRLLGVRPKTALLITAGTAICGGSAIAAIAPITEPDEEELAISMGTVFALNSVALFAFPLIGFALHMTQTQFGLWSALAIHDTSSVVGAAAKFGPRALAVGTVVKLTRSLWIIPLALLVAFLVKSRSRLKIPWFIAFFCLAAASKTVLPGAAAFYGHAVELGHIGLALTLFLIGTGINVEGVKRAGSRVLLQGTVLWIAVAAASLICIRAGWIHL
jgi:uncharacterized integral membrane protein (TIGR00698 family)